MSPLPMRSDLRRFTLRRAGGATLTDVPRTTTMFKDPQGLCKPPPPPSPRPPPSPSPPPSPGLPPVEAVVVFSATVDATMETFDDAAYRQRIATRLGVPRSAVQTVVAPGSVIVVTEVSTSEEAAAQIVASVETLVNDPDAAADMYGAPATVSSAVTQTPPSPPPSPSTPPLPPLPPLPAPPPGASGADDNSGLLITIGVVVAIVVLIVVGVVVYTLQSQERAKVGQTPAETQSLKSVGKKVVAVNKLTPRSSSAQPVAYGRRSGYAYAQVARAAHSSGGGGSSQQEFRFSL
jgi:hypothetical protein